MRATLFNPCRRPPRCSNALVLLSAVCRFGIPRPVGIEVAAAGIEEARPQGGRRQLLPGEEATLGATAAGKQPERPPRTSPESPAAALKIHRIIGDNPYL